MCLGGGYWEGLEGEERPLVRIEKETIELQLSCNFTEEDHRPLLILGSVYFFAVFPADNYICTTYLNILRTHD